MLLLLLGDVLKSVNLCTSLPQDSLLGLLSTGEGGKLARSADAGDRAGMAVLLIAVFNSISCVCGQLFMRKKKKERKQQISTQTQDKRK